MAQLRPYDLIPHLFGMHFEVRSGLGICCRLGLRCWRFMELNLAGSEAMLQLRLLSCSLGFLGSGGHSHRLLSGSFDRLGSMLGLVGVGALSVRSVLPDDAELVVDDDDLRLHLLFVDSL